MHLECFDNSNIQGTNPVSSCVVFKNANPPKCRHGLWAGANAWSNSPPRASSAWRRRCIRLGIAKWVGPPD